MSHITTITPKYQVHIPSAVRKEIGLKHGRAKILAEKGRIIIEPDGDSFLSLKGAFRVKNPIPAEKIRDFIDNADGKK